MFELQLTEISHIIQQVFAPALLLAGIGSFLNVMAHRLSRVIDRARQIESEVAAGSEDDEPLNSARNILSLRARLISLAMGLATATAVIICGLIAMMFVDALLKISLMPLIEVVFIAAMLTLMASLIILIREVFIATAAIRRRGKPAAGRSAA